MRFKFSEELEKKVLTQLIDQNLLVSNHQPQSEVSTVEIAHEALNGLEKTVRRSP